MTLILNQPSLVQIPQLDGIQLDSLRQSLSYTDKKAVFTYNKFKKNGHWFLSKNGAEAYEERLLELKNDSKKSLLFQNDDGTFWTYSGLAEYLSGKLRQPAVSKIEYPKPKMIPWKQLPTHSMRPYQSQMVDKLMEARHGGIEVATGLGKSLSILHLVKNYGLKSIVMAPSVSIAKQLLKDFKAAFGIKYVGQFFGGKKEYKKKFVIAVGASLTRVEPETEAWKYLSQTEVFVADEAHLCPATTLVKVCFGLMESSPYRFFFSATQMRNDGLDLLLQAITGPIVFKMSARDGVDEGFLAKPIFSMVSLESANPYRSDDPNAMTRKHLLYNPYIAEYIARIANLMAKNNKPTLILIDEVEQFGTIFPYLNYKTGFAHGPLNEDNKVKVPEPFWKSDNTKLVQDFNDNKLPILVGTSCISTGTDTKAVEFLIYWQGGKSEIKVKQAIGRGTRIVPGKKVFQVLDFDVVNIRPLHRHAMERRKIYNDLYGGIQEREIS